jgi:hypothetical protein
MATLSYVGKEARKLFAVICSKALNIQKKAESILNYLSSIRPTDKY